MLYSYLRYTDRILDVLFLQLAVTLPEFHEKLRKKYWVTEKSTQKNLFMNITFFWLHVLFLRSFFVAFVTLSTMQKIKEYTHDIL